MRNENYYNVSKDDIGGVSGDVVFYSEPVLLLGGEFGAGLIHDLVGTRLNVFTGLILASAATVAMPFGH